MDFSQCPTEISPLQEIKRINSEAVTIVTPAKKPNLYKIVPESPIAEKPAPVPYQ